MQGYYKCSCCGYEAVSTVPYKKLICQGCFQDIPLTRKVTDEEAEKLIKTFNKGTKP